MVLPSIVVKEKRKTARIVSGSVAGEQWMDVVDGGLRCLSGVEQVQVLTSGGMVRCEWRKRWCEHIDSQIPKHATSRVR